jgi:hypothetical protein
VWIGDASVRHGDRGVLVRNSFGGWCSEAEWGLGSCLVAALLVTAINLGIST